MLKVWRFLIAKGTVVGARKGHVKIPTGYLWLKAPQENKGDCVRWESQWYKLKIHTYCAVSQIFYQFRVEVAQQDEELERTKALVREILD